MAKNEFRPGQALEAGINNVFRGYRNLGIYCERYHPERGANGQYIKGHDFDYGLFYNCQFYAFDAKESQTDKWSLQNAKQHQIDGLMRVHNQGGEAFFLVLFFPTKKIIKIFVENVIDIKKERNYCTVEDGIETKIDLIGVL